MNVQHTLNDQLMMSYAAGVLPEAFSLVVASHLSLSEESRAGVASYEAVCGALLEDEGTTAMSSSALDQTMARIVNMPKAQAQPRSAHDQILPKPLRDYIGGGVDAIKWRKVGGGVKQAIIPTDKDATARLLYIPAGQEIPDHGHRGTELTLVLQGAYSDELDRFARGDLEIANEDLEHTPRAEQGLPCICLAATDAPLKFNSWLPRIMQPFVRI